MGSTTPTIKRAIGDWRTRGLGNSPQVDRNVTMPINPQVVNELRGSVIFEHLHTPLVALTLSCRG
jgi:hypothetical protein